jgi:fructose-1,6-bisphosphatase/inositol monophosphatase family enzyme
VNADLELAERAAHAAGEVLLSYYGRPPEGVSSKSSATDLVSDADREAERAIRELLESERPRDGLVAEEGSRAQAASGRRWVVDPLDGTINFLYGFPAWAVSVALEDGDGVAVGVVHSPINGETFYAVRGEGAFVLSEREPERSALHVRPPRPLAEALVSTGFSYEPARRAAQADVIRALLPRARDIRRAGAAALDLAWLAAGRVDAFFERGLQHWDWAAGRLLVEEAGGSVAWLDDGWPGMIAASADELLAELRPLVSP